MTYKLMNKFMNEKALPCSYSNSHHLYSQAVDRGQVTVHSANMVIKNGTQYCTWGKASLNYCVQWITEYYLFKISLSTGPRSRGAPHCCCCWGSMFFFVFLMCTRWLDSFQTTPTLVAWLLLPWHPDKMMWLPSWFSDGPNKFGL